VQKQDLSVLEVTRKLDGRRTVQEVYEARQDRREHPDGEFDKAGRWYPSDLERCECCNSIRYPSRSWPYSLLVHCRSKRHVANLLAKEGL
jgi:hypothetical protein